MPMKCIKNQASMQCPRCGVQSALCNLQCTCIVQKRDKFSLKRELHKSAHHILEVYRIWLGEVCRECAVCSVQLNLDQCVEPNH